MKLGFQTRRQARNFNALLLALISLVLMFALFSLFAVGTKSLFGGFVLLFIVCALLAPRPVEGGALVITLILPLVAKKLMDAYKARLPMLKNFMFDFGKLDGLPERVKFDQEIIAQWPQMPTATPHAPGDDLTNDAQNVKDLISESSMRINQAVKVVLKVPTADAVRLELDPVFDAAIQNAGYALALHVVMRGMRQVTAATFTHEIVEAAADVDKETLGKARIALNDQEAGVPRFGIVAPATMSKLTDDPRIASGDYHGKLVDENPYVSLKNLEGFTSIDEFPRFPTTPHLIGTLDVADAIADPVTDKITIPQHGLPDGARVRLTNSGGAVPAGLAVATDYFTRDVTMDTFKLAATRGGAAINITDAGTGTNKVFEYEELLGFFFAQPAMLFAIRGLNDNVELAKQLGIPVPILVETKTDPDTGLTFTLYMWINTNTHDIYVAAVVAFGVTAGRQAAGNVADSATDKSGVRLVAVAQNTIGV